MGSGHIIKKAILKHGKSNFVKEILYDFDNADDMFEMESVLVNEQFVGRESTYNAKVGGIGGFDHIHNNPILNEKRLQKMREYQSAHGFGWENLTEAQRSERAKKSAATRRNNGFVYKVSDATKTQLSKALSGEKNGSFGTKWCVKIDAKDKTNRKKFRPESIPDGWVTIDEWKSIHGRVRKQKWFNDGVKDFFIKEDDEQIEKFNLVRGRLNMFKKTD